MKKFKNYVIFGFCLLLLFIINVHAEPITNTEKEDKFNISVGDTIKSGNDINGSSILAGNNVTANNNVAGIDMLFGNVVNYDSQSDYSLIAGNSINLTGLVKNDGFIFGNLISFDESFEINRDLIVFGNSVTLKGKFDRDITIYAASVDVSNATIAGDIKIYSSNIKIENTTTVDGQLSYNKDAEVNISNDAKINSILMLDKIKKDLNIINYIWSFVINLSGTLLVFLALSLFIPKLFKRIENTNKDIKLLNVFSMLGFGALALILVPILFLVFLSLFIGAQLAILLLICYIVTIWLSGIFSGYLLGNIIWKRFVKKDENTILIGLIGISIISILSIIPYLGTLVSMISLMIGIGIVLKALKRD